MAACAVSGGASAFEAAAPHLGTRAMGMAGVFAAQADDCSAVWYNPGSLQRADMIQRDTSIEYGSVPAIDAARGYVSADALKSACGYWAVGGRALGVGIGYATLYRLGFDITETVQPLSLQTFGATDVTYRQASILFSAPVNARLAIGGTLDFLWTDIDCSNDTCVDFGPMGLGATFGAVLDITRTPERRIAAGALWRTRATLRYRDTPDSGVGAVLDDYIPDRPQSFGVGLHLQHSLRHAVVNSNATLEHVSWSAASSARAPSEDFDKLGASAEVIVPAADRVSVAARAGVSRARAARGETDVDIFSIGAGVTWGEGHGIDIALQHRAASGSSDEEINHASVSYTFQN